MTVAKNGKQIDLASLDTVAASDKGFELELLHPVTSAPLGQFITVVGSESTAFKQHVRAGANARLRRQAMRQQRGKDAEVQTIEQLEEDAVGLLVACTTGFRGITFEGAELAFTPDNARKLYTALPFVRTQVDEAVADLSNFFGN